MKIHSRNARTYPIILSIVAHVLSCRPLCEDTMRQLVILPHDRDRAQQVTSAAWLRSSWNLMTSATPPAFLGAFVVISDAPPVTCIAPTPRVRGPGPRYEPPLFTVTLSGIRRQGPPCPFSGLSTSRAFVIISITTTRPTSTGPYN